MIQEFLAVRAELGSVREAPGPDPRRRASDRSSDADRLRGGVLPVAARGGPTRTIGAAPHLNPAGAQGAPARTQVRREGPRVHCHDDRNDPCRGQAFLYGMRSLDPHRG